MEVECCNARVPVYGPFQLCACVNTDIARRSAASGSQQVAGYAVDAIMGTVPPEEIRIWSQLEALRQVKLD